MRKASLKRSFGLLALAAVLSMPLVAPASAQHWDRRRDEHWRHDDHRGGDAAGALLGGALLGLGVGAAIGAATAPPPVYYAPPPAYAAPPPPPVYYGY